MRLHHQVGLALVASLAVSATASASYVTSFEQPEYIPGGLVYGQDGWNAGASQRVQTASQLADELEAAGLSAGQTVRSGNQALIATTNGSAITNIRKIDGLSAESQVTADIWFRPLTPGTDSSTIGQNLNNTFIMFEDENENSGRAAGFRIGATVEEGVLVSTSIDLYANGSNGPGWYSTGVSWEADEWYNIRFNLDYSTQSYTVAINGVDLFPGMAIQFQTGSDYLHQIRIYTGLRQAGAIFDDVSITGLPEPTTIGMLLASGGAMLLRRGERASRG